jgi:hypothetical protein
MKKHIDSLEEKRREEKRREEKRREEKSCGMVIVWN